MWYHWRLGVGHLHAHQPSCIPHEPRDIAAPDDPISEQLPGAGYTWTTDVENDADYELNNPEMALEDRKLEGWNESDDLNNGNEEGSENNDK